jgi:hypothetical protein
LLWLWPARLIEQLTREHDEALARMIDIIEMSAQRAGKPFRCVCGAEGQPARSEIQAPSPPARLRRRAGSVDAMIGFGRKT